MTLCLDEQTLRPISGTSVPIEHDIKDNVVNRDRLPAIPVNFLKDKVLNCQWMPKNMGSTLGNKMQ